MNVSPRRDEVAEKRAFYRNPRVVAEYDRQRFGGKSGDWVNEREIAEAMQLLPPVGRILDLGCGTGRLSQRLVTCNYDPILLDASDAMLARAVPTVGAPAVLADAFSLPFRSDAFDAVVALRLAFHFADVTGLLASVARVLRPGGRFILDTYRWSPRSIAPIGAGHWGGKVFVHSAAAVRTAAASAGLVVVGQRSSFLFSPYVYRRLPWHVVKALAGLEARVPAAVRLRDYWALAKPRG